MDTFTKNNRVRDNWVTCTQDIKAGAFNLFHNEPCEATVTLTAPSSPPCFGQTYKLTCTHPVLEGGILLRWERNGTMLTPQADDTSGNTTATTLTITVTREEFENKVYTYRCITFDSNLGFINDPNRVISNEVTVDPPGE